MKLTIASRGKPTRPESFGRGAAIGGGYHQGASALPIPMHTGERRLLRRAVRLKEERLPVETYSGITKTSACECSICLQLA